MNPAFLNASRPNEERRIAARHTDPFIPDLRDMTAEQRLKLVRDLIQHDPENLEGTLALFVEGTYEGQKAQDKWRVQAQRDALTNLFNKGAFDTALEREIHSAKKYGTHASLLTVDMDMFKSINDTHGHPAGDAVLKKTAALLLHNTREGDIVARTGGDEFSIILTDTSPRNSYKIVSRLNRVFSKETQEWNGHALPVRASIGIVDYKAGQSREQLIEAADNALYAIKQSKPGRQQRGAALKIA